MFNRKIAAVFIIVFTILLSTFSFYGYQMVKSPNILVQEEDGDRYITIPEKATFQDVQNLMFDSKTVNDMVSFSFMAKLMKYDENVRSGKFLMKKGMSNVEAIRTLRMSQRRTAKVTFNNIRLKGEIGEKISKNIDMSAQEFSKVLEDFSEGNTYGFSPATVISMFIPNTYEVYTTIGPKEFLEKMYQEYLRFWNKERRDKAVALGLSPVEVAILASIVQAEQLIHVDERRRIAGLYLNRLRIGMKLDSDPTLVFALGDFSLKRVLNEHKKIDSPYNTYKYGGLPPGPINMPDISSIDAVLNHEEHPYIYMCAKEDFSGYHNFAKTLSEHSKNARRYQQQLSIEIRKGREQEKESL